MKTQWWFHRHCRGRLLICYLSTPYNCGCDKPKISLVCLHVLMLRRLFHFRNMQLRSKGNTIFQRGRTPGWKEILSCIYMKELLYFSPQWSSHCRPNLLLLSVFWLFLTNTHTWRSMIHAVHMQYEKDANSFKPKFNVWPCWLQYHELASN